MEAERALIFADPPALAPAVQHLGRAAERRVDLHAPGDRHGGPAEAVQPAGHGQGDQGREKRHARGAQSGHDAGRKFILHALQIESGDRPADHGEEGDEPHRPGAEQGEDDPGQDAPVAQGRAVHGEGRDSQRDEDEIGEARDVGAGRRTQGGVELPRRRGQKPEAHVVEQSAGERQRVEVGRQGEAENVVRAAQAGREAGRQQPGRRRPHPARPCVERLNPVADPEQADQQRPEQEPIVEVHPQGAERNEENAGVDWRAGLRKRPEAGRGAAAP